VGAAPAAQLADGRAVGVPDDHPIAERARLKAAAKAEGVNLEIRRRGNTIVFNKTNEVPKLRGGGARRGQQAK
jgi:hypothetical protein